MPLLRRLLALEAADRRLLVRAGLLVTLVRLALGRIPFRVLHGQVTRGGRARNVSRGYPRPTLDRVIWAVTAVSQRAPGTTTCLARALVAQAMLAHFGFSSRLCVGVVHGEHKRVEGHAWVECEGRTLIGGTETDIHGFVPIAAFDVDATYRLRAVETLQGLR